MLTPLTMSRYSSNFDEATSGRAVRSTFSSPVWKSCRVAAPWPGPVPASGAAPRTGRLAPLGIGLRERRRAEPDDGRGEQSRRGVWLASWRHLPNTTPEGELEP